MAKRETTARNYGIALGLVAVATFFCWICRVEFGPVFNGYMLVFVCVLLAAAWRGYGPGILSSLIYIFLLPFLLKPNFTWASVDPSRTSQILLISILVSTFSMSQRRTKAALERGKDELESRVSDRTSDLETANAALLRAERRLHDVLNSVSESFLALDKEWHFTFVNRRIADSLGQPVENVTGRVIWDVFPEARHTEFYPQYLRVMEEGVPVHFEMFYAPSSRWLEVTAHPTPEGLSAYVMDITERKAHEAELATFVSIVESSNDAIVSKNLDGTILTWNSAAERIYGHNLAQVVGRSMESIIPAEKVLEEQHILEQLRRGKRIDHFETVRVRSDGKEIDVSLTVSPVRDAAGKVIGASHIARDITEQKNFERQLHQVQKLESLGVLAGGVAHDFNNLLVGIIGNASLALDDAAPQSRQLLEDVISAGEKAADLTRQLLAYAGKGKVHTRLLDLSSLVREISTLVRTSMSRSVELRLDMADSLPPVMADSSQMQQIVMNLVINAAEAIGTNAHGTVTVTTARVDAEEQYLATSFGVDDLKPGAYVTLEVQDTGSGMDEATIARIFDPFFTTKFPGRGLGLSAVLGIVRSHGGALKVYSVPGRGTTFRVLFPAAAGEVEVDFIASSPEDLRGSGTVLVVDDDDMVRKVARTALEKQGYTVLEAANGEAGLTVLRDNATVIRAVLLDLTMPVMGGEEALRYISTGHPGLPVILSSGFNESEAMHRFSGKGVAAFLQKPYTVVRLARLLRDALAADTASDRGRSAPVS